MKESNEHLQRTSHALDFIDKCMGNEEFRKTFDNFKTFDEVAKFAKEQGFKLDHTSFAEAMKIHVDRTLERSGIPAWIRYRIHAPVHD
jgi:hypothetical protein